MSGDVIEVERHGAVEVLRISRPDVLNALNGDVLLGLTAAVKRIRDDPEVRAYIITGADRADGRPCFSAGDDLKEAAAGLAPPGNPGSVLTNTIDNLLKPSIAVIDGICTTGALEIALACDLRLVAEDAEISDWHLTRLGSGLGGWGASTRLARLVGVAQAKELMLSGRVIDGTEALRIGLAQRVFPRETLWDEAMTIAASAAGVNPVGLHMTMAHLSRVEDLSKEEALSYARQLREWFAPRRSLSESLAEVKEQHLGPDS